MSADAKLNQPDGRDLSGAGSAPRPRNPCLAESVHNAQILLAFASQRGNEVSANVVKAVVEAGAMVTGGQMTNDQEVAFWAAQNALAKAVAPVSVTSLRATLDSHADATTIFGLAIGSGSLARKAVRWYTGIALITLGFLLLFQIYWLFGTSITAEIQKINKESSEVEATLRSLQKLAAPSQGDLKKPSAGQSSGGSSENPDIGLLKVQKENLALRKASSYELLSFWSGLWERIVPEINLDSEDPGKQQLGENIARLQTSMIVLEVLQRYLLPLLYGLLGTCVYVLRTLSSEIKDRTYSEASNIGFRIRLYLGTLGGMVFAWFVTPEATDGLLKSLSPFALAFLAGYSVELLFAAMDRFLAAFTSKAAT